MGLFCATCVGQDRIRCPLHQQPALMTCNRHQAPTVCGGLWGREGAREGATASSRHACEARRQHNVNGQDVGCKGIKGSVLKPGAGPWLLVCQQGAK